MMFSAYARQHEERWLANDLNSIIILFGRHPLWKHSVVIQSFVILNVVITDMGLTAMHRYY